jgi:hypothetical protein
VKPFNKLKSAGIRRDAEATGYRIGAVHSELRQLHGATGDGLNGLTRHYTLYYRRASASAYPAARNAAPM